MRRLLVLVIALCAIGYASPAAHADDLIGTVTRPTPISSFDGRVVWSDYDPAVNRYFLVQRMGGVTSRLPIGSRDVPFDADLGPDVDGKPVVVYSRCRRDPPVRDPRTGNALAQLPEWRRGQGCNLFMYSFEADKEVEIRHASTAAASEFLPTVWTDRIAFARVFERRRGDPGRRAYLYVRPNRLFASQGRSGHTRRMPGGPRAKDLYCTGKPRHCKRLVEPGPTSLDLATRRLTFGWDSTDQGATSTVWLDVLRNTGRTGPTRVDYGGSGEIQARELVGPQFDDQVRIVYLASFFGDTTAAFVRRYSFMGPTREEARLVPLPGDPFVRTVLAGAPDGAGYVYLASGLTPPGEPCTPATPCLAEPGCSTAQPCLLLRAAAPAFEPAKRKP
jgi:hypothetical protein